jgi:hypothetical protein
MDREAEQRTRQGLALVALQCANKVPPDIVWQLEAFSFSKTGNKITKGRSHLSRFGDELLYIVLTEIPIAE